MSNTQKDATFYRGLAVFLGVALAITIFIIAILLFFLASVDGGIELLAALLGLGAFVFIILWFVWKAIRFRDAQKTTNVNKSMQTEHPSGVR